MSTQAPEKAYARPLGTLENFFKKLADTGIPVNREHWTISLVLGLEFPSSVDDPAACLVRAWQVLRHRYPALGATVIPPPAATAVSPRSEEEEAVPTLAVDPFDAEAWTRETFIVHDGGARAEALFEQLRPTRTATCHWVPGPRQLIFRSSHWRIDGVGIAMLGHEFMAALADVLSRGPDAGFDDYTTHQKLPNLPLDPPLEVLAQKFTGAESRDDDNGDDDVPSRPGTPPALAAGADALVGEFLKGLPSIGLPTREGSETAAPGSTTRISMRFDAATSARITTACRARLGVSVTSAVHAAVIRVTASFPQHPLASRAYSAFTPVDLRRVLAAAASNGGDSPSPLGLLHSGLPVCIEEMAGPAGASKSFEAVARELGAVYSQDLVRFRKYVGADGREQFLSLFELAAPYVRRTTRLFNTPPPPGFPPVQNPDVSSLGKLERYIQREYEFGENAELAASSNAAQQSKVGVADIWMGTEILWRSMQFHTWSWRDEITLSLCFNQSFYDDAFAQDILGKVAKELLVGLGID